MCSFSLLGRAQSDRTSGYTQIDGRQGRILTHSCIFFAKIFQPKADCGHLSEMNQSAMFYDGAPATEPFHNCRPDFISVSYHFDVISK